MKRKVYNRPLTPVQAVIKARKWRLIASRLYVDLASGQVDGAAQDHLRAAHNAMCEAFRALEDQARA